ncbi:MAG: RraA family protein [Faecousia sp.]
MKYTVEQVKQNLYSGVISDVLDSMGCRNQAIGGEIAPLTDDIVIFGPAFTSIGTEVYSMPAHPLIAQCKVVDQLKPGDIYILVTRGNYNCALFGELFATNVRKHGCEGVLMDGYARDIKELKQMKFPIFYRGRDPRTSKGRCEINECQIPVTMCGVTIHPGDYIFGDCDGVLVIPKAIVEEVLDAAFQLVDQETVSRQRLVGGATMEEIYADGGAV